MHSPENWVSFWCLLFLNECPKLPWDLMRMKEAKFSRLDIGRQAQQFYLSVSHVLHSGPMGSASSKGSGFFFRRVLYFLIADRVKPLLRDIM